MQRPTRLRMAFFIAAGLSLLALGAAACGGDDAKPATAPATGTTVQSPPAAQATTAVATAPAATPAPASPTAAAAAPTGANAAAVRVGDSAKGKVLTNASGRTLYTFKSDSAAPGKSACNGACATTWPPVIATAVPPKPEGASGEFTLITRDDGTRQLAYKSQPLYVYSRDNAAGDVNGDGVGSVWFVAAP